MCASVLHAILHNFVADCDGEVRLADAGSTK